MFLESKVTEIYYIAIQIWIMISFIRTVLSIGCLPNFLIFN